METFFSKRHLRFCESVSSLYFLQCIISETKSDPMSQKHYFIVKLLYNIIIFSFKYSLRRIILYNHSVPIYHMNLHKTPVDINTCTLKGLRGFVWVFLCVVCFVLVWFF